MPLNFEKNNEILILDIETTGFLNQGGKIVEIGMVLLKLDTGEINPVYDSLIFEDGFDESHTIQPLGWIFRNSDLKFQDVKKAPTLDSQRKIIQGYLDKYFVTAYNKKFDLDFLDSRSFEFVDILCPMMVANPLVRSIGFTKEGNSFSKYPSVTETWHFLYSYPDCVDKRESLLDDFEKYDDSYFEKHRALSDAIDEAKIIFKLFQAGKFTIPSYKMPEKQKVSEIENQSNSTDIDYYLYNPIDVFTPELYNDLLQNKEAKQLMPKLIPFRKGYKWGFSDINGNIKIKCKYSHVDQFKSGIAKVCNNEKWGFINSDGDELIPIIFDNARSLSEGLIAVKTNRSWGYINMLGEKIIDFKFDDAYDFSSGMAGVVLNGKIGFVNKMGVMQIKPSFYEQGLNFFLLSKDNKEDAGYCEFRENIALVSFIEKSGKYGFINPRGEILFGELFESAKSFNDGYAIVKDNHSKFIIDRIGTKTKFNFYDINSFNNNYCSYKYSKKGGYGFLNSNLDVIIDPIYYLVGYFSDDLCRIQEDVSSYWRYINKENQFAFHGQFSKCKDFSEGIAGVIPVKNSGGSWSSWGFIDTDGNQIISPKYESVDEFKDSLCFVNLKAFNLGGFIDKYGNEFWEG